LQKINAEIETEVKVTGIRTHNSYLEVEKLLKEFKKVSIEESRK